jgi:HAD superfamily hydrolase (TIGR01509 family)
VLRPDYPIGTARLTLRPFRPDDLDGLFAIQSKPEVTRFLYWYTRDREQVRRDLDHKIRQSTLDRDGQMLVLAVVRRDTGALIGAVNLQWLSREHRQGEIGFVFNPDHHGHGFATEAAEVMLRLGFADLGLHRIVGRLDARNEASARVLTRLGMRHEAHFVQNEFVKGEWTDEAVYAILAHEWKDRSARGSAPPAGQDGPVVNAVVFDLDGVLIDSEPVWEEVRRGYVAETGGRWQPDSQQRLMGMSTQEWARYLSLDLGVGRDPDRVAAEVVDRMARRYDERLPLLPGAIEAVRRTAERWPLGLASSSPRRLIGTVLERAGLASLFAVTISTEEVARGKPAPDVYLAVAEKLGVPADTCVAVEDSSNGLRSAHAAGMRVVAVPHPTYPPQPDALAAADLVIARLDELTPDALLG